LVTSALLAASALAGCPLFPADSQWNQRADALPVLAGSDQMVSAIGRDAHAHADFGSGLYQGGPIGIPYKVVGRHQRRVHVSFDYPDESDRGPYPIPRGVPIEGGANADGDRHVIVVDRARCRLYELFDAHPRSGGRSWHSNRLRPAGWTSADAAGLPILPGLARYDEVRRGHIDHALRITVPRTRRAYIYPARHLASSDTDPSLPAMGQRVRLRNSFPVSRFPRQARVVLRALQRYGALVADNGSAWFVSGAPSRGWDNQQLSTLGRVTGADFQVVDTSRLRRPR
jgi:hypothetical protein